MNFQFNETNLFMIVKKITEQPDCHVETRIVL